MSDQVEVSDEEFGTVRRWIGVYYEDGRGDEAFEALDHLETSLRKAEAERDRLMEQVEQLRKLVDGVIEGHVTRFASEGKKT